jgi:diacylglycerol kinase family enzyme
VVDAVGVVVANGRFMGPGVPVAPEALLDDGLFDMHVFLPHTTADLLRALWSTIRRRRPQPRRSIIERASWVRITSERPLAARADAMDLGSTPVVFEIRPSVLSVVAPDPSASSSASVRRGPHLPIPGHGVPEMPSTEP